MKISMTLRRIVIIDVESNEQYEVTTLRTVQEISAFLEETEKEFAEEKLAEVVKEAYQPRTGKTGND